MKKSKDKILLIGMPGCGKSILGNLLAISLGYNFLDADNFLENHFNITIKEMFSISENYFRNNETECGKILCKKNKVVIASGGGFIKRKENMDLFKDFTIIFLNRPVNKIIDDIDTNSRPLLKDGSEKIYTLYNERIDLYKKYCDIEIINKEVKKDTISEILYELNKY